MAMEMRLMFTTPIYAGQPGHAPGLKFKVEGTPLQTIGLCFPDAGAVLWYRSASAYPDPLLYRSKPDAARKSTIVAIAVIGFFYILTLFMGLGAMTNAVVNPLDNNMSAPLLARSFGEFLFAVISAIAFATVLGTVSGLIIAASGAVAHDLMDRYGKIKMTEKQKCLQARSQLSLWVLSPSSSASSSRG